MPDRRRLDDRVSDLRIRDRRDRILLERYARTRDPRLREELIERFLPLARSLANRYRTSAETIEDLTQVACEGLVRAVDGYDPARANGFSSYATPMILGALRHHFRDASHSVHVPRGLGERIQKLRAAEQQLNGESGSRERVDRLAELTGLTRAEVEEGLQAEELRRPLSADRPIGAAEEGTPRTLADELGRDDDGYDAVEASLASAEAGLKAKEREALLLYFGAGLNQRQVGERIGVSQMQVSRLLRRALKRLLSAVRGGRTAGPIQGYLSEPGPPESESPRAPVLDSADPGVSGA